MSSFQGDPRSTYKIVNRLLDKECGSQIFPNGESDENLANAFGNLFYSKVNNIYAGIETEQCLPGYTPTRNTNSDDVNSEFTEFDPVSDEELLNIIKSMPDKSCANDPIPTWLYKKCLP